MKLSWLTKRLGDLLEVQNGYAFDSKEFNPSSGLPLIRIRSLKAGIETETRFGGSYDNKYVVNAGDLLIGMDGEFGCYVWKGEPALLNQRVCRLQGFDSQLLPRFLFYGVNTYLKAIEDVTGYTTVKHISSKQILDIDFPVPPLPEQQRIVTLLDEAFDGIATARVHAEKNLQNARAIFESHLQSVFTQVGNGWIDRSFGEVADFRNGINFTQSSAGNPVKILGVKDFRSNYWAPLDNLESVTPDGAISDLDALQRDDIVFVRSNGNPELIGRCLLIGEVSERTTHSGFTIRARLRGTELSPTYLCHFLKSKRVRKEMVDGGNGANIRSLNQGTLSRLVIPVPSVKVQTQIVVQLEALVVASRTIIWPFVK